MYSIGEINCSSSNHTLGEPRSKAALKLD